MSKVIKYTDDDSAMEIEKKNKRTKYSKNEMIEAQNRAEAILKRNLEGEPLYHAVNDLCDIIERNKSCVNKTSSNILEKVEENLNSLRDKGILKCHNDGKGKRQSFEFYFDDDPIDIINSVDIGYGETKEEALKEYINNLNIHIQTLVRFSLEVFPNIIDKIVMVDCFGKPI